VFFELEQFPGHDPVVETRRPRLCPWGHGCPRFRVWFPLVPSRGVAFFWAGGFLPASRLLGVAVCVRRVLV